jgi:hypothetical protein
MGRELESETLRFLVNLPSITQDVGKVQVNRDSEIKTSLHNLFEMLVTFAWVDVSRDEF